MHALNRALIRIFGIRVEIGVTRYRHRPASLGAMKQVFRDLESRFGDRFDFVWTEPNISSSHQRDEYFVKPTDRRHKIWLSYVSEQLKERPGGSALDVASDLTWCIGVSAKFDLTVVDIRRHPCADEFPFRFQVANVAQLPFEDSRFDVVSFPQVLHHVGMTYGQDLDPFQVDRGVAEVARVLRRGGVAVGATWVKPGRSVIRFGEARIFGLGDLRAIFAGSSLRERAMRFRTWPGCSVATEEEMLADPIATSPERRYFAMFTLERC